MPKTHMSDATSARVGLEVRRARVEQKLSQAEVARRMGVKPPYVAGIEAGTRNLTLGQLANIADALERGLDITFPTVEAAFRRAGKAQQEKGAGHVWSMPPLPESFRRPDLEAAGFVGWLTWDELRANDFVDVPAEPMAYVVYRPAPDGPEFRRSNPGGRFKGRNPTVSADVLAGKWVPHAQTVYVGKADVGVRRLKEFARFGAGEPVGHWGGRYIWQLVDSDELLVAWHPITWDEVAREYEKRLLSRFSVDHDGRRPFANIRN
jgi:transcriptional regulator with XRE-family HTH domain